MSDINNFNFMAVIPDPQVRKVVRDQLDDYTPTFVYDDEQTDTTLSYGANEVTQGSVDDCFSAMLGLIRDGVEFECPVCEGEGEVSDSQCERCAGEGYFTLPVPDFAFGVNDEPQDEYLGTIRMHVPGLPDFEGPCDGDGTVVVPANEILKLVDEATDLEQLREALAARTGRRHAEYFKDAFSATTGTVGADE